MSSLYSILFSVRSFIIGRKTNSGGNTMTNSLSYSTFVFLVQSQRSTGTVCFKYLSFVSVKIWKNHTLSKTILVSD